MIDVNKITSTLAKLPDAQLQQYAQMHKNDPYIMALAMSESNRRKELRDAAPAQQGMQEQPKVVDQMVAEMAPQQMPEEMGIGRLPAGDMNFANGGIIAFASGGDVERYNGETGSLTGGSLTGIPYADAPAGLAAVGIPAAVYQRASVLAGRLGTSVPAILKQMGYDVAKAGANVGKLAATGPGSVILAGGVPATQFATDIMANNPKLREAYSDNPMMGAMDPNGALAAAILDQANPKQKQKAQETLSGASVNSSQAAPTENNAAMGAKASASPFVLPSPKSAEEAALLSRYPTSAPSKAAPRVDNGRKGPAAGPLTAATQPVDAGPQGIDALLANYQRQTDLNIGQARNATAQYAKSLEDEGAAFVEAEKKRIAEKVDPYKGREERLNKREGELEGMGSKYAGLALLQAGAAMMSTPGGIGMALGKGVQVGSERYAAGIEKINAAKEKFAEARERLDDLRINRADMDARDIRDAEKEARLLKRQGKELFYSGAKDELNMKDKQITAMMGVAASALNTDKQIAAERENTMLRERGAYARAAMPSGQERIASLLGGGDLAKGLAKLTEIQAGKFNPMTAYTDYVSKRKEGDTVLTPQEFVTQIRAVQALMAGAPGVTNKPTGKVFD